MKSNKICPTSNPELFVSGLECYACKMKQKFYIPKYIVQKIANIRINRYFNETKYISKVETCEIEELKEFNDLEEARKFKRDLESYYGILIE